MMRPAFFTARDGQARRAVWIIVAWVLLTIKNFPIQLHSLVLRLITALKWAPRLTPQDSKEKSNNIAVAILVPATA